MDPTDRRSSSPHILTSLHPSEVDLWLDHLTISFAHKPTPRSYFQRHLQLDPTLDFSSIAVLSLPSHPCISTSRLFLRAIYIAGHPRMCGGVGEVSTQPPFRGKGYAELCLQRNCSYLSSLSIPLSSLHTSNVPHYYHKLGWRRVDRIHGILDLSTLPLPPPTPSPLIQPLTPDHLTPTPLLTSLISIHTAYAPRFNGPVHRSEEYWTKWVKGEWTHSLTTPSPILGLTYHPPSSPHPSAYLFAVRLRWDLRLTGPDGVEVVAKDHLTVREFACTDKLVKEDGGRTAFLHLISGAVEGLMGDRAEGGQEGGGVKVRVALPIVSLFQPPLEVGYTKEDVGFMYRPIGEKEGAGTGDPPPSERYTREEFAQFGSISGEELMEQLHSQAKTRHLFFDTDAF